MYTNNRWPSNFSGPFVAGANDHASYYTNGGLLGSLEGCRDSGRSSSSSAAVTLEATEIPRWLLIAAGVFAVFMLMKKK
jgi:hypothetical protein